MQPIQQNEWSVELLRGIAALLVVFAHYWKLMELNIGIFNFSFTGVDLFFVISGFVFAPYLFGKKLSTVPHFIRRFFRIYPLYVIALCAYAGLHWYQGLEIKYFLHHLFFLHTLESYEIAFHFNPAFWSLPPEIEFYLFLPLLAYFIKGNNRFWILVAIALMSHLIIAYLVPLDNSISTALKLSVHLFGLLIEFLLGSIAWLIVKNSPQIHTRLIMFISGMILWLVLAFVFSHLYALDGDNAIRALPILRGNMSFFAAIAFMLMVAALVGWVKNPPNSLKKIAIILGNLSYGLYLFHNATPIILQNLKPTLSPILFGLICFLLTVAISGILHLVYEAPLRNFGRKLANSLNKS